MIKIKKQFLALAAALVITVIWGSSFVVVKNSLGIIGPFAFLAGRFFLATLALALFCGRRLAQTSRRMVLDSFIVGLCLFAGYAFQTQALPLTTASNTALITTFYIILVPVLGLLFGHRLSWAQLAIAVAAVFGLAILIVNEQFQINPGDVLVLLCALAYTLHFLFLDRYTRIYSALLFTFWQVVFCGLLSLAAALIAETLPAQMPFNLLLSLVYCGLLATALGFYVQTKTQQILSPTQASVAFSSEAVFGAFFGWLLLEEIFSPRQALGALLLLLSLLAIILLPWAQDKYGWEGWFFHGFALKRKKGKMKNEL
ncbi:MAG: DMT family transporter [Clostridiales bacterium]|nr:DMT family transporter [Clostridiales bacterium]MDR2713200.1 DMT family transporter [Clostridiales bacterium]